jgi:hypothetical protein
MSEFTIKEFAAQERVTERTVRNWIAKGAVCVRRTPGGGVRILVQRTTTRGLRGYDKFGKLRKSFQVVSSIS